MTLILSAEGRPQQGLIDAFVVVRQEELLDRELLSQCVGRVKDATKTTSPPRPLR